MSMRYGLNCGSGQRPFHSTSDITWINVDAQYTYNPDLVLDLKGDWQEALIEHIGYYLEGEMDVPQLDYVVWHHCWEHEGCGEARHFQAESYRVLKPGGSMLVFVPDMRALAQGWLMGKVDTQVYMTNVYGAYMGSEHDRHKFGYTRDSLVQELSQQPWGAVNMFDWRKIPGADIAGPDWWILGVEATK